MYATSVTSKTQGSNLTVGPTLTLKLSHTYGTKIIWLQYSQFSHISFKNHTFKKALHLHVAHH